ncbi:MAG: hypothetical protein JW854_13150, partial [Actinobacteria bacterium]|nr:hypothetical protein [Actinomycetota bacterium]
IIVEKDSSDVEIAQGYIRQGIAISEEAKTKPLSAQGYLFLGEVFEIACRKKEALENLKKAEQMYLEMKVPPNSYWLTRTREGIARLESVS